MLQKSEISRKNSKSESLIVDIIAIIIIMIIITAIIIEILLIWTIIQISIFIASTDFMSIEFFNSLTLLIGMFIILTVIAYELMKLKYYIPYH